MDGMGREGRWEWDGKERKRRVIGREEKRGG